MHEQKSTLNTAGKKGLVDLNRSIELTEIERKRKHIEKSLTEPQSSVGIITWSNRNNWVSRGGGEGRKRKKEKRVRTILKEQSLKCSPI